MTENPFAAELDDMWQAFVDAGFMKLARVGMTGCPTPRDVYVRWYQPDIEKLPGQGGGALSTEYEVQYRVCDLPTLAANDQMVIDGVLYAVRENPRFPESDIEGNDGTYKNARLKRV